MDVTNTVREALEAEIRIAMAERAAVPCVWETRAWRDGALAEINELLDTYNLLTLGR